MRENDWTKVLAWPGYRVYQHEINEPGKTLKLWVRRKRGNRKLVCAGCGSKFADACRPRDPILKQAEAEYAKLSSSRARCEAQPAATGLPGPVGSRKPKLKNELRFPANR